MRMLFLHPLCSLLCFTAMALIPFCAKVVILFGLTGVLYVQYERFVGYIPQLGTAGPAHFRHNGLLGPVGGEKHPIERLVEQAKANHAHMVSRQSKTLGEAVTEYKRRYSREPPPGFENWYQAAIDANATIIDEYDTVMEAFEPFWSLSGREIRARVQEALHPPVGRTPVVGVHLRDQIVSLTYNDNMHAGWHARILKVWIEQYIDHLPEMDIAFNSYDEPDVVIPHDQLERSLQGCPPPQKNEIGQLNKQAEMHDPQVVYFDWLHRHRNWHRVIESCPLDSASRSRKSSEPDRKPADSNAPLFIQNITRVKDICEETDAASLHGFFTSPDSFVLTNSLVPVFSKSKASSFQDLLLPAVDYDSLLSEGTYKEYNPDEDMPWEDKKKHLYWAGSSTDGYYQDSNWKTMQRVRLVRDLNNASLPVSLMSWDEKDGLWKQHNDTMRSLSKYVDVKFTAQIECDQKTCDEMNDPKNGVVWKGKDPVTESYANRFLMDIDGHTFTERFRHLLSSKSLVFKMTMFQVILHPIKYIYL